MNITNILNELRQTVNSIVTLFKIKYHVGVVQEELNVFDSIANVSHKEFETNSNEFKEAQNTMISGVDAILSQHLETLLEENEKLFRTICENSLFDKFFGFEKPSYLSGGAISKISLAIAINLQKRIGELVSGEYTENGYAFYINVVSETLCPLDEIEYKSSHICPNCGETVTLLSGAEFGLKDVEVLYGCSCGCYALATEGGKMIGSVADTQTHKLRNEVKKIIGNLMVVCGYSIFEAFRVLSYAVGKKLRKNTDIEFLTADECKSAIEWYRKLYERLKHLHQPYPTDRKKLIEVLRRGGRLRVISSVQPNLTNGRLLVPASVGEEAFLVTNKEMHEIITFSKRLEYEFHNNTMEIKHPSGEKEKYRIYLPVIDFEREWK